jgi:Asp-tRNA(Asn)/Glu-tRNA(Gln) amidotransferase A subunit family amidase
MTELLDQGAAAIAAVVRTGRTRARDAAESVIARVEARNTALTAMVAPRPRDRPLLAMAQRAESAFG